ncbi:MAG: HAD family hydrolase [Clostridia bacterium]|nr:HAD family hydrolase [Clostridia bacterium]
MYKAIIFDLDGTIADTLPAICEAVNLTLSKHGYPMQDISAVRTFIGNGARKLITRALPEQARSEEIIDRVLADYDAAYTETFLHTDETYPGMREAIAELRQKGCRIGVLSNKQDHLTRPLTHQLLPGLVDVVFGQRSGFPIKPDPTIPLQVAAELGASPAETAFVGDSDVDILTGIAAGFTPIGVSWGYRSADLLRQTGAKAVADHPSDLPHLLLS